MSQLNICLINVFSFLEKIGYVTDNFFFLGENGYRKLIAIFLWKNSAIFFHGEIGYILDSDFFLERIGYISHRHLSLKKSAIHVIDIFS